ncbi:hypothetical protein BKA62DRAFT_296898 [Auriculariales sp. MPI-PUGE-AT-0066]|nr:hypothetical protein BKA62DRAFT_296898 [Auriculariales sp. MPI-PUGE-AT-0066]
MQRSIAWLTEHITRARMFATQHLAAHGQFQPGPPPPNAPPGLGGPLQQPQLPQNVFQSQASHQMNVNLNTATMGGVSSPATQQRMPPPSLGVTPAISRLRADPQIKQGSSPGAANSPSPIATGSAAQTPATIAVSSPKMQPKSPKRTAKKPGGKRRNSNAKTPTASGASPAADTPGTSAGSPAKMEIVQLRPQSTGKRGREDEPASASMEAGPSVPSPKRMKIEVGPGSAIQVPVPPVLTETPDQISVKKEEENELARLDWNASTNLLMQNGSQFQEMVTAPTDPDMDVAALLELLQSVASDAGGEVDGGSGMLDLFGTTVAPPVGGDAASTDAAQYDMLADMMFDFTRYDEDEAASKANTPELVQAGTNATIEESPASVLGEPADHGDATHHGATAGASSSSSALNAIVKERVVVLEPGDAEQRYLGFEALELVAGAEAAYYTPGLGKWDDPGQADAAWAIMPA